MSINVTKMILNLSAEPEPVEDVLKRVSVTRLARMTGYTTAHVSRVLNRRCEPSVNCLRTLSHALQCTMDALYERIENGIETSK